MADNAGLCFYLVSTVTALRSLTGKTEPCSNPSHSCRRERKGRRSARSSKRATRPGLQPVWTTHELPLSASTLFLPNQPRRLWFNAVVTCDAVSRCHQMGFLGLGLGNGTFHPACLGLSCVNTEQQDVIRDRQGWCSSGGLVSDCEGKEGKRRGGRERETAHDTGIYLQGCGIPDRSFLSPFSTLALRYRRMLDGGTGALFPRMASLHRQYPRVFFFRLFSFCFPLFFPGLSPP